MHHLPDFFIGDTNDVSEVLREAKALCGRLSDEKTQIALTQDLALASNKLNDWIAFRKTEQQDFGKWCAERGRTYEWVRVYYYNR
ncbi:MAG TPA: hypothetical protein VEK08_07005 [Planctomycetota bacterium]|nr:hypothetical protein [Planctomycetota bacterium]